MAQEFSHAIQLCLELVFEVAVARCFRFDIAELGVELAVLHCEVAPADHAVAPKQRQSVIAELAFGRRRVGFETVEPSPTTARSGRGPAPPDRRAPASAPCPAAHGAPHPRPASTSRRHRRAHARAAVWPAARHSSTRPATAARQSAAGARRTTGSHRAAARRCGPPHRPARRSARGARLHRSARARAGVRRRCGCRPSRRATRSRPR